jgi:hypothetical protein
VTGDSVLTQEAEEVSGQGKLIEAGKNKQKTSIF